MRYQAYQTVLGGAFGHTYGHERIFSFGADDWDWKSALDSPGARSMTHFAKLMNSISDAHLLTRMPDQTLVDGDEGKTERLTSTRISAMRTSDGRLAMLYSANGRSMRVRMDKLGRGGMNAWWFNPRTGMWHNGSAEIREQRKFAAKVPSGPGAPVKEFDPPGEEGEGSDWMLILCTGEQL
jgi:hypothetical protein